MSAQEGGEGSPQTTLGYWSRRTTCPLCGQQGVPKRGLSAHIASEDCEVAERERDESEFAEVRAR